MTWKELWLPLAPDTPASNIGELGMQSFSLVTEIVGILGILLLFFGMLLAFATQDNDIKKRLEARDEERRSR